MRYTERVKNNDKGSLMKLFLYSALLLPAFLNGHIRDIFNYDTDWLYADYDIIAQGIFHDTGKTFKVLQCGSESKIVVEK